MSDRNPPPLQTGYCTNVHAGQNLSTVLQNIRSHSLPVRDAVVRWRDENQSNAKGTFGPSEIGPPDETLGLGLWFSEISAKEALLPSNLARLKDFLEKERIRPYTFNGFPQSDFHQPVVKHRVYKPTWYERSRLEYTLQLIELLDELLPAGQIGSISTLPISWGEPALSNDEKDLVVQHWTELAMALHRRFEQTGRRIVIAVEPEPGCAFTDSASFRQFYTEYFLPALPDERLRDVARRYIGICHDICHAAVMFEDQAAELQAARDAGIPIGKVQVSSAVSIPWDALTDSQCEVAWAQLKGFAEDRYLHQVSVTVDGSKAMHEDLPIAIEKQSDAPRRGEWRIHFHVPIYLRTMGSIVSTQTEIEKCLEVLLPKRGTDFFPTGHFEVETYAWTVLPTELRTPTLSEGIAQEMIWLETLLHRS